jgi:hypothetical protein
MTHTRRASARLKKAKSLITQKKNGAATTILEEVLAELSETKAAGEAAELLKKVTPNK